MDYAKKSLRRYQERRGKIEVIAAGPVESRDGLSLACTPGVARL